MAKYLELQLNSASDVNKSYDKFINKTYGEQTEKPQPIPLQPHTEDDGGLLQSIKKSAIFGRLTENKEDVLANANKWALNLGISPEAILYDNENYEKTREIYEKSQTMKNLQTPGVNDVDFSSLYSRFPGLKEAIDKGNTAEGALLLKNIKDVKETQGIIFGENSVLDLYTSPNGGTKSFLGEGSAFAEGWNYGANRFSKAMLYAKSLGDLSKEDIEKGKKLDKEVEEIKTAPSFFDAPVQSMIYGAMTSAPDMLASQGAGTLAGAAVGGIAGAVMGIPGGPAGIAAGAVTGAWRGATVGGKIGKAVKGAQIAGNFLGFAAGAQGRYFEEELNKTDRTGKKVNTPQEAWRMALGRATINAAIETASFGAMKGAVSNSVKKAAPGIAARLASKDTTAKLAEIISTSKTDAIARSAMADFVSSEISMAIKVAGTETTEEMAQELADVIIDNMEASSRRKQGFDMESVGFRKGMDRILSAGVEALPAAMGFGLIGGTFGVPASAYKGYRLSTNYNSLIGGILDNRSYNGTLDKLKAAPEIINNLKGKAPEAQNTVLQAQFDKVGMGKSYVDLDMLRGEDGGVDAIRALAEADNLSAEQTEDMVFNQAQVEIKSSTYTQKLLNTEHDTVIRKHMTLNPEIPTLARAEEFEKISTRYKELMDQEQSDEPTSKYLDVHFPEEGAERDLAAQIVSAKPEDPFEQWKNEVADTQSQIDEVSGMMAADPQNMNQEQKSMLDKLKERKAALASIGERMKSLDKEEMEITAALSKEGYEAYKTANALLSQSAPDKQKKTIKANSVILARMAQSFAKAMNEAGHKDYTVADYMKTVGIKYGYDGKKSANLFNQTDTSNGLPKTGSPFSMPYYHNKTKAPKIPGDEFAQSVEPAGEYIGHDAMLGKNKIDGYEYGNVTFQNPLVIEHESSRHGGWKTKLSEQFNGKKGKALSAAIKKAGYDGIITVDSKNNEILETVNLSGEKSQSFQAAVTSEQKLAADEKKFAEELDHLLAGKSNPRSAIDVMTTPIVMKLAGAEILPIKTHGSKLLKIIKEHPEMTSDVLKQIPRALTNPIFIFRSSTQEGRLVVVLDLKDKNGNTIIVPFELNISKKTYEANFMTSAYGKENKQWFAANIKNNNVLYVNNKKATSWLKGTRLQLPFASKQNSGFFDQSIPNESDLVKLKNDNNTFYQKHDITQTPEFKAWFGDSKAVDEKGKPLILYHGTYAEFDEFNPKYQNSHHAQYGDGFYFTEKPETAKLYGDRVIPVYLKAEYGMAEKRADRKAGKQLKDTDYVHNKELGIWIVKKPTQIKSVENNGGFDANNPNIYQQKNNGSILIGKNERVIELFETANASTFIHELGHLFLDDFQRLAKTEGAGEVVQKDFETVLNWLGMTSTEEWNNWQQLADKADISMRGMPIEKMKEAIEKEQDAEKKLIMQGLYKITVAHEKFANGFMAYLATAKAPAKGLKAVMRKFKRWLMDFYTSIMLLDYKPSSDVEAVFNRMLTVDADVDTNAATVDTKMAEKIKDAAKEKVLKRLFEQYKGAPTEAEAKTEADRYRASLQNQELWQVNELWLAGGKNDSVLEANGYSKDDFEKRISDAGGSRENAVRNHLESGARNRTAQVDPEQVAKMVSEELVAGGTSIKIFAEEYTMLVKQMEADPDEQKRAVMRGSAKAIEDNIRAIAKERIDSLPIGQASSVGHWLQKAAGAARRYANAMRGDLTKKGALDKAAAIKQEQMLYAIMARLAVDKRDAMNRTLNNLRRMANIMNRKESTQFSAAEKYHYNMLMYKLGLQENKPFKPTLVDIPTLEGIFAKYDAECETVGTPDSSVFKMLDDLDGYAKLSQEDFEIVTQKIMKVLYTVGRDSNVMKTNGMKIDDVVQDVLVAMELKKDNYGTVEEPGLAKSFGRGVQSQVISPETMLIRLFAGENNSGYDLIFNTLQKAAFNKGKSQNEAAKEFKALSDLYSYNERYHMSNDKKYKTKQGRFTKEMVLMLALNWGNKGNRQRIEDNMGLGTGEAENLLATLDARDWKFVSGVWELINKYWDQTVREEEHMTGMKLKPVEAEAFVVTGDDGQTYALKGGYFPIAYNPKKSSKASETAANDITGAQMIGVGTFNQGLGFTKARAGKVEGMPLLLDFSVISNHLDDVTNNIAMRAAVRDVAKILNNKQVSKEIADRMGEAALAKLKTWVSDTWKLESTNRNAQGLEKGIRTVRINSNMAIMGYRLSTALLNAANLPLVMNEIGTVDTLKALASFYNSDLKQNWQRVMLLSPELEERAKSMDVNIRETVSSMKPSKVYGLDVVQRHAYDIIAATDLMLSAPMYLHVYDKVYNEKLQEIATKNQGREITEADIAEADMAAKLKASRSLRKVFGSGSTIHLSAIQKTEVGKIFTPFYSFFNAQLNTFVAANAETLGKKWTARAGVLLKNYMMIAIVQAAFETVIRQMIGSGNDDDDFYKAWAKNALSTTAAGIPFGAAFTTYAVSEIWDGKTPYGGGRASILALQPKERAEAFISTAGKILHDKGRKDWIDAGREFTKALNAGFGIPDTPVDAIWTTLKWGDNNFEASLWDYLKAVAFDRKLDTRKGAKK